MKKMTLNIKLVVLMFSVSMFLGLATANPTLLPYNTYLNSTMSNIHSVLDGFDGVEKATIASYSQPWGLVTYESDGSFVPRGTMLWIIAANDKQVVGEVVMTGPGGYNFAEFGATYGIYGDNPSTTTVDEGAAHYEPLIVAALIGNKYHQGYFGNGVLPGGAPYGGYQWTDQENDIVITNTVIPATIPEPMTITSVTIGLCVVGWLRRRKKL